MNCERFQQNLYEYLDDALSPDEKAAAQSHLQTCGACRQAIENEQLTAQTLSGRLSDAVKTVTLDAHAQRSIANAVRKQIQRASESLQNRECGGSFLPLLAKRGEGRGEEPEGTRGKLIVSLLPFWIRLAIPAAALVLISAVWLSRSPIRHGNSHIQAFPSSGSAGLEVPVHVAYPAPRYTFLQQGAMVVDAFTTDTRVADGTLLVKTHNQILYDH